MKTFFKVLALIYILLYFTACGTMQSIRDPEAEKITGTRTVLHFCLVINAKCVQETVDYAKLECTKDNKSYEQVVPTNQGTAFKLIYKCKG